jgi:SAM-dependent methyltransferase
MAFVLTPDMLLCPDCRSDRIAAQEGPPAGFKCGACGTFIERRGPVINAVPKTLSGNTTANLGHYEEMANSSDSLLDRRAKTRNHRIKFETIMGILGLGGDGPKKSVFEVGAGAGTHGAEFARIGHHYVGLDLSATALYRAARQNAALADAPLLAGDATRIPLRDNLFDTVFCVATLHHLPEPLDGLREMVRVLKPGGIFCFMEPRWCYPTQLYGYFQHPDVEVGTFKVMAGRLLRALRQCGVSELGVRCCVYTPNSPLFLIPAYDLVDRVCAAVPPLHALSVVRCMHGVK